MRQSERVGLLDFRNLSNMVKCKDRRKVRIVQLAEMGDLCDHLPRRAGCSREHLNMDSLGPGRSV